MTRVFVPQGVVGGSPAIVDGEAQGERVITGRLQPRIYPAHDKYMLRCLELFSGMLLPDELSYMKVPLGQLTGPKQESKGFKPRAPLAISATSKLEDRSNPRNTRRDDASSGVNEVLYMMHRIVQPDVMHAPLAHFGLSAEMQRKNFEPEALRAAENERESGRDTKRYVNLC